MEAIIFCGIQATGKSTFFKERFFKTHVHISLDLLRTRHRETKFLELCIQTQQSFVIDNTNPSKIERLKYIAAAKEAKFSVIGYFFQSKIDDALLRNEKRQGKEKIPEIGIKGTFKRLELLEYSEGFDEIYLVEIIDNQFIIKEWKNEI